MDLGFKNAGFDLVWANDNASSVWETFESNLNPSTFEKGSISDLDFSDIPDCEGVIGGPPCQSWSNAGTGKGLKDKRGKVFLDFIRLIDEKKPKFFVAENVEGLLSKRNASSLYKIKRQLRESGNGYRLSTKVLNASDYGVPQNRKRVFFVGYEKSLNKRFRFPKPSSARPDVKGAIWDLRDSAVPAKINGSYHKQNLSVHNHEYWVGSYSYIFMSRNRVLSWNEPSYTIQASGRQASIHPNAPKMEKVEKDVMKFKKGQEHLYRRLTIRECARLQGFPDDFEFIYSNLDSGYKMVGNAVPVPLAEKIAKTIAIDLSALRIAAITPQHSEE